MEKHALLRFLMKSNPAMLRKLIVGRPKIELFKQMSPIVKAKLLAGRKLLETEAGAYRKIIELGLREGAKDKALLGAAIGSALGAGSLGWSLAKENPETDSRLAKILTELLFLPEEESKKKSKDSPLPREEPAPARSSPQFMSLSDLYNNDAIDWGSE